MNLNQKSFLLRKDVLDIIYKAKAGHIGGDFSVMEILVCLYYEQMNINPKKPNDPMRDRFILSKGHSVEALYAVLADKGFFSMDDLSQYGCPNTIYIGHPNNKVNGIEVNSGSLGHGLPLGVGMALAAKMDDVPYRTYVVMGDGELAEGSVWEGFMSGSHFKLDNLCAVIDKNTLQISGRTCDVMNTEPLFEKISDFGWNVIKVDGNKTNCLTQAFTDAKLQKSKPTAIIAETIKGYGVSFMENKAQWHHCVPSLNEYTAAKKELDERMKML